MVPNLYKEKNNPDVLVRAVQAMTTINWENKMMKRIIKENEWLVRTNNGLVVMNDKEFNETYVLA